MITRIISSNIKLIFCFNKLNNAVKLFFETNKAIPIKPASKRQINVIIFKGEKNCIMLKYREEKQMPKKIINAKLGLSFKFSIL